MAHHYKESGLVNVIADADADRIAGFVALSASQIGRGYLPKAQQRNQPDPIPVVLLGQLAVDNDFQSRGYATSLILFALRSALRASEEIGCVGVVTHPLDDIVHGFYKRWGFDDLPFDPRRAMIVRMSELRRIIGD
jgi:predicted N-acetyltransferase YhbS